MKFTILETVLTILLCASLWYSYDQHKVVVANANSAAYWKNAYDDLSIETAGGFSLDPDRRAPVKYWKNKYDSVVKLGPKQYAFNFDKDSIFVSAYNKDTFMIVLKNSFADFNKQLVRFDGTHIEVGYSHPVRHARHRGDSSNIHIETHGDHSPAIISEKSVIINN